MSELGDYLRKARKIKGLSQAKVHAQIGITNSRICKAENGADNILSAAELKKLAVPTAISMRSDFESCSSKQSAIVC